jgi:hypothetical protein
LRNENTDFMHRTHDLQTTIDALASFPATLARMFNSIPQELRQWAPPSWAGYPGERLNAVEQICHLRDIEIEGYRVRFDRTRREVAPMLADFPGEPMAQERNYAAQNPDTALREFTLARAANVETMRGFSDADLRRTAIFEGTQTTLAGLVHFLCGHDCLHLAGLQWLLAKSEQA